MSKFSKLFLYITVAALALWQLPSGINLLTTEHVNPPFTIYSALQGEFMTTKQVEGRSIKSALSGKVFTDKEFDSLLPAFYVKQLVTDGRFPDSLHGVEVTPQLLQQHNFNFRTVPSDINAPKVGLYPLFESMSKRVELETPSDIFRITSNGIEFVVMNTNEIDTEKSSRFTEALSKAGFSFPANYVAGNPTTRKDYDNGYLLCDANKQLFHLKMTVGRPYVRAVELPTGVEPTHLFVTEFAHRNTLGFFTDSNNNFYTLTPDYKVRQIAIPSYNPEKDYITIMGNMFDWTVRVVSGNRDAYYAIDNNDYSLIKSHETTYEGGELPQLHFTSTQDKFVKPRLSSM